MTKKFTAKQIGNSLRVKIGKLKYGKKYDVKKKEAINWWAAGWMSTARKNVPIYHNKGINKIVFIKGDLNTSRKI